MIEVTRVLKPAAYVYPYFESLGYEDKKCSLKALSNRNSSTFKIVTDNKQLKLKTAEPPQGDVSLGPSSLQMTALTPSSSPNTIMMSVSPSTTENVDPSLQNVLNDSIGKFVYYTVRATLRQAFIN